jgi:hypothetical protein
MPRPKGSAGVETDRSLGIRSREYVQVDEIERFSGRTRGSAPPDRTQEVAGSSPASSISEGRAARSLPQEGHAIGPSYASRP